MEAYQLPDNFYTLLCEKYQVAKQSGEVQFKGESAEHEVIFDSSCSKEEERFPFQLTLLKSLAQRPVKGTVDADPFANEEPELTILSKYGLDDLLRIVFNKFPVVDRHFMAVTREFESQNSPLNPSELLAMYFILKDLKLKGPNEKWFSFYNCGQASGMLQPHKHFQFMTLPNDKDFEPIPEVILKLDVDSDRSPSIARDEPLQHPKVPFAHYIVKVPETITNEDQLGALFVHLLTRTITDLRDASCEAIAYNFIMTTEYMMMVPRVVNNVDGLGLNSCAYMSLLLCKNEELVSLVKDKLPMALLAQAGLPNTYGIKRDDSHY